MDLIGYLVLLKVQLDEKTQDLSTAYNKFDGVDQLGLPKMPPTYWYNDGYTKMFNPGAHKDIDKIHYTKGTGY
jgi:hypothetical protein